MLFKDHTRGGEHQLEYTEIFQEYEGLVDATLSDFAKSRSLELADVYAFLRKASQEDEFVRAIIDMVLASADYDKFVSYMASRANRTAEGFAAEAKAGDSERVADDYFHKADQKASEQLLVEGQAMDIQAESKDDAGLAHSDSKDGKDSPQGKEA